MVLQGWANLPLRAQIKLRNRLAMQKLGAQNQSQCPRLIQKQLETVIFVL